MDSDFRIIAVTVTVKAESRIMTCIVDAIKFSKMNIDSRYSDLGPLVTFEFYDTPVTVRSDSDPEQVYHDWERDHAAILANRSAQESDQTSAPQHQADLPTFSAEDEHRLHEAFYNS